MQQLICLGFVDIFALLNLTERQGECEGNGLLMVMVMMMVMMYVARVSPC
jgi:hypothetical protein